MLSALAAGRVFFFCAWLWCAARWWLAAHSSALVPHARLCFCLAGGDASHRPVGRGLPPAAHGCCLPLVLPF
jgi:hypothetical protein